MLDKLNSILQTFQDSKNSNFSLKYFVVLKEPTIQGKLWQCLTELLSRKEMFDSFNIQTEEIKENLELAKIKEEKINFLLKKDKISNFKLRELKIKLKKQQRHINILENSLKKIEKDKNALLQEIHFLLNLFYEISKFENLKPFSDENAQKEYWGAKLEEEINLRSLLQAPLNIDLVKTILSLPKGTNIRNTIENNLLKVQKHMIKLLEKEDKKE